MSMEDGNGYPPRQCDDLHDVATVEPQPDGQLRASPGDASASSRCSPRVAESLANHDRRFEELAREISAVREATAVSASAFMDLRGVVQEQLDALRKQIGRIE